MTASSFGSLRRVAAWAALAVTLIATPGPADACACAGRSARPARCVHCGPRIGDGAASARLERPSCCSLRSATSSPAVVTTPVLLDRTVSSGAVPAFVTADPAVALAAATIECRPPPSAFAANAPPALVLERFLRL